MKRLIIFLSIFFIAFIGFKCQKENVVTPTQPKTVYYRIKQVDKDGTVSYSKILITKE
jgi:hypothetical protein